MSTMPAELDEVFQGFFHEYSIIIVKWRLYNQLFGDSESIDLLNRHGAHGFGVIQDVIIKDVILCITRMMNTSKEAWGDPANLATLMIDLAAHKQTALAEKLRGMRDRIKPVADGLRQWRDGADFSQRLRLLHRHESGHRSSAPTQPADGRGRPFGGERDPQGTPGALHGPGGVAQGCLPCRGLRGTRVPSPGSGEAKGESFGLKEMIASPKPGRFTWT